MFLNSWLHVPRSHRSLALNNARRRQPLRWPTRSRPSLEHLEERTLLDVASGVISVSGTLGSNFAAISIGDTSPIPTSGEHAVSISGLTASGRTSQDSTDSLLAQDQPSAQLRLFSVNSQGDAGQLSLSSQTAILRDAYGFGSGTQPNRPWAPAAYNLGLANHQFGYPSMTDLGFSATPPWFRPTAKALPKDQPVDGDEVADLTRDASLIHESTNDREQDQPRWTDENAHDQNTEKAATEEQTLPEETALEPTRGDPAVEKALFSDPLQTLATAAQANRLDPAAARLANVKHSLAGKGNTVEGPAAEDDRIPSSLWISALAPAQMAALVAGMPGVGAPANGGDLGSVAAAAK